MAAVPTFLIVGAMKSGTTTLYHDLQNHPDIFMPTLKEPETLVRCATIEAMRAEYATLFAPCKPGQIPGEASTAYTKRPDHDGAAANALALCGPGLRVLYVRRDPIDRIVSHYKHEQQFGGTADTIDAAVRIDPRFIDYSRYDWQIAPWIEAFGRDHVLELSLDDLSNDRAATVARVLAFLGADPARLDAIDESNISNSSAEQKYIGNPVLRAFIYSGFYQNVVKPRIPRTLRERARRSILPPPKAEAAVAPETARYIRDQLATGAPQR